MKYIHLINGKEFSFDEMVLECVEHASASKDTPIFYADDDEDERRGGNLTLEGIADLSGYNIDFDNGYILVG